MSLDLEMRDFDNSYCVILKVETQKELTKACQFCREKCEAEYTWTMGPRPKEFIFLFENTEEALLFKMVIGGR